MIHLTDEMRSLFETEPICYLGTTDANGVPNVVPVGFKGILENDLLLVDLFFKKTRSNLKGNPYVAVAISAGAPYKRGFQFKGKARIHREGPAYEKAASILRGHGVDAAPYAAIAVVVEEVYLLDPGERAGARLL